jgi:hypothetical protein
VGWGSNPGSFDFDYFLITLPPSRSGHPTSMYFCVFDIVFKKYTSGQWIFLRLLFSAGLPDDLF